VARAESDQELVELARRHARDIHQMEITDEQAMAMAKPDPEDGRG
jgi:predicted small metal-binding protein